MNENLFFDYRMEKMEAEAAQMAAKMNAIDEGDLTRSGGLIIIFSLSPAYIQPLVWFVSQKCMFSDTSGLLNCEKGFYSPDLNPSNATTPQDNSSETTTTSGSKAEWKENSLLQELRTQVQMVQSR